MRNIENMFHSIIKSIIAFSVFSLISNTGIWRDSFLPWNVRASNFNSNGKNTVQPTIVDTCLFFLLNRCHQSKINQFYIFLFPFVHLVFVKSAISTIRKLLSCERCFKSILLVMSPRQSDNSQTISISTVNTFSCTVFLSLES